MRRFSNRGGECGGVEGAMMSFCFWVICCCLILCIVPTYATTHQNEHPPQDFVKRLRSASDLSLHHQENVPESLRSARSSLGLPRNDDSFWAMRGKRPDTDVNTNREERPQTSRSLDEKQIERKADAEAYTTDKETDEDLGDENNISERGRPDDALWFPQEKEAGDSDEDDEGSSEEDMLSQKRNQPYWISRDKKGISEYIPFYWGSNQNVFGKMPLRKAPTPVVRSEPNRSVKSSQSNAVSGWASNQNLWGKRNDNGPFWIARGRRDNNRPFWIARGKKQDTETGPYWIARGKRPIDAADQYWDSNPFTFGKRTNGKEVSEVIIDFQACELSPKREDNDPFWLSRGKKPSSPDPEESSPFWVSHGKRSGNTTFWVTRGKKAGNGNPFWVARGKKELEEKSPFWIARGKKTEDTHPYWVTRGKKESETSPFWIARGKKEDETPTNFWVARGKKDDSDKTPLWIARGKKENESTPTFWVGKGKKESETTLPFWVARGKKESETTRPFWAARGKKDGNTPFWIARGKKADSNPFWISSGKKEDPTLSLLTSGKPGDHNPFWVARGKKEGDSNPYWITRGKKESETTPFWVSRGKKSGSSDNPFWIARGKKDDSEVIDDGSFWISRGRRISWAPKGKRPQDLQDKDRNLLMAYIMESLLNEQATDETQGLRGKKGSSSATKPLTQTDDTYSKGFVALRG